MININGQAIDQLDHRFAMHINHVSEHPSNFSTNMAHDMRIGIGGADLMRRPNLKPSYRKRISTAEGHFEEMIDFMDQDLQFSRIKDRFNDENPNPFGPDDEDYDPDFEWGWFHFTLWEELKIGNDPDPFGAQMAVMGRYLLFYRHWFQKDAHPEDKKKFNNGLPGAQAHSLPYLYRLIHNRNPSWNSGIGSVKEGMANMFRRYASWRVFLEDCEGILSAGRYADIKRADPIFKPLRDQINSVLAPNSHGIMTMLLNGVIHSNAVRPTIACNIDLEDVRYMENVHSDADSDDSDAPNDNDVLVAHSYGTHKSHDLHIEQELQFPGHKHGSAGYAGRVWQHTRRLLQKHRSMHQGQGQDQGQGQGQGLA